MAEQNFVLNNVLCDRISINGTDMTRLFIYQFTVVK